MVWVGSDLLAAALDYQRRGYSVIPLQPRGKMPTMKWEVYSNRRATEEEIREWWRNNPNANIGLVMGRVSGKIAVDVDVYRGGDAKRVFDIAPTELISRTGRGGYHMMYDYDDSLDRNIVGKNGVDVRSNGGYIVAPPSIHENGQGYQWIRSRGPGRVPSSLVSYLKLPPITSTEGSNDSPRWVADALLGVGHGSRNDTCAKLAGYYAGKGIPKDIALIMMSNWDSNNNPPLGLLEVETTVNSVYRTSYKYTPIPEIQKAKESFGIMGMNDYMIEYGESAVNWIIPEWLPQETIAFIASPPGTYKTWMLLDLAISVAGGKPFLGNYEVENPGPVLMIQQEDHHGGLAERMGMIMNAKYSLLTPHDDSNFYITTPPEIPLYMHPDRKLRFNNKIIMDALEEVVEQIKPKLVIIDPLYSAAETDDYMAKSAGDMFRLKEMRDKYHCSFIIAHHKKKKTEGNDREGLWGSQFLNAFLETGWQVRSTGDTSVSIRRHFKVKKEANELTLMFDINTERFPYKYQIMAKETAGEVDTDIMSMLEDGSEYGVEEFVNVLGSTKSVVTKKLNLLVKDRMIIKGATGKYRLLNSMVEY